MHTHLQGSIMDLIDEVPLGGKKLGDILTKSEIKKPSSGLSKLLGQVATELNEEPSPGHPSDQILHNEFLRLEREKNENLTQTISQIHAKLDHIVIPESKSEIKNEKKVLNLNTIIPCATLILGLLLGASLFSSSDRDHKEEVIQQQAPTVAQVPKIEKVPTFVTIKFANIRKEASPDGELLKTITPNQVLEKIEQKGGWFKVKYTDLVENRAYTGWIWYELMKKIEEKK